jgi:arginyl-tRNA---protein transferase
MDQPPFISPEDYEVLLHRGWRRSGRVYYKPDVRNACCPHYTLCLEARAFRPTKKQRKVVNAFNSWILGHEFIGECKKAGFAPGSATEAEATGEERTWNRQTKRRRKNEWDLTEMIHEAEYDRQFFVPRIVSRRKARKKAHHRDVNNATTANRGSILPAEQSVPVQPAHKLQVSLEPDKFTEEKYLLYSEYQRTIHHDPPSKISRSGFKRFLCSGFSQSLRPRSTASLKDEPTLEGRALWDDMETLVESEAQTRDITHTTESSSTMVKPGSYHMCYRLDGKLVAFGVLDLLPMGVSSVYLVYVGLAGRTKLSNTNRSRILALHVLFLCFILSGFPTSPFSLTQVASSLTLSFPSFASSSTLRPLLVPALYYFNYLLHFISHLLTHAKQTR